MAVKAYILGQRLRLPNSFATNRVLIEHALGIVQIFRSDDDTDTLIAMIEFVLISDWNACFIHNEYCTENICFFGGLNFIFLFLLERYFSLSWSPP